MKLLFDQNLSPRLPRVLVDIYPESVHVREINMRDATDTQIWEYAKTHGEEKGVGSLFTFASDGRGNALPFQAQLASRC